MTERNAAPVGQVADAAGNWVDRYAPQITRPYLRLSRADRPIGTWLLLLPCWWSIALAAASTDQFGWAGLWVAFVCALGAFLMRGAGCTWNDITDREFDAQVARTRSRPLPSGQASVVQATIWMIFQSLVAFALLLTLEASAIALGVLSLLPVAVYPFAKRFTWWPQVFLGLAFNWGALLAWSAMTGRLALPAVLLYLGGIAWTLFYDTIYAHQDTEDDALIGIKSTARLFGETSPRWLLFFAFTSAGLVAIATGVALAEQPVVAIVTGLLAPAGFLAHMLWQLHRFDPDNAEELLRLFRSNRDAGLLVVLFFAFAALI